MIVQKRLILLNNYFASVFEVEGSQPIPEFPDRPFILTSVVVVVVLLFDVYSKHRRSCRDG